MSTAIAKLEEWEWTPEREKCLNYVLAGWPKTKIAEELKVHRNTVTAWCQHPAFVQMFNERQAEAQVATRVRRVRETSMFADRTARLLDRTLKSAEEDPANLIRMNAAQRWAAEFRSWRAEERQDTGENVQRRDVRFLGQMHVEHEHTITGASFKTFIEGKVTAGVIDTTALETETDAQALVVGLAEQALLEGELADAINEEDRAQFAEEATDVHSSK